MKLHILSDLHTEGAAIVIPDAGADLLILAGDTITGRNLPEQAARVERMVDPLSYPALMIPGNHEFYHTEWLYGDKDPPVMRKVDYAVDEAERRYGSVRILALTWWPSFNLNGTPELSMVAAAAGISDFHYVLNRGRMLWPVDLRDAATTQRDWLIERLAEPWDGRTVVVSHYVPTVFSVDPRFRESPLNPYFTEPADNLMDAVDLWIHGHTHTSFHYQHPNGRMTVVCNPRGYIRSAGPENPAFDPALVVEI